METTRGTRNEDEMDAEAQLAMLAGVQNATEVEAWMPPTPVWQAPILAAGIAGLSLASNGPDGWTFAAAAVSAIAFLFCMVDQHRRQGVSPRQPRKPLRILAFYGLMIVVSLIICLLWVRIDWPADVGPLLLNLAGAWLATSLVFALGITTTNWMRNHWAGSSR